MNGLELVSQELQRPKSRRRKKILKLITPKLISDIESEIISLEYYLIKKIIDLRTSGYQPNTGDEDQPKRDRVIYLREILKKLK